MKTPGPANLLDVSNIDMNMPEELTEILAEGKNVRIERIVSTGQSSPENFWYDQKQAEWVLLLAGEAELEFECGHIFQMSSGHSILIHPHSKHRVKSTSQTHPTIWLAVFFDE